MCDIEGGEEYLIDPKKCPALKRLDLIVEVHEYCQPGLLNIMIERFKQTHDIIVVKNDNRLKNIDLPESLSQLSSLDRFLITYEDRAGPTPWVVMTAK